MFSQTAVNNDVYYGEVDDFSCDLAQISSDQYIALLRQRGKEDLAENPEVMSFEGEAETSMTFKYGVDFFVGDIVQVSDEYGHDVQARVVELVLSDNEDGTTTAYPTFSTFDYEAPEPDLLPDGYTKLEYIYSSGTQYIDTGFKPNQDTRVVADVYLLTESSYPRAIFGTRDSATSNAFVVWAMKVDEFRTDYGSNTGRILVAPTGRHTIDKNRNATYVDETLVTLNTATFQATKNLLLFTQQDSAVDDRMTTMRLYSCKIYNNGILARNFIPCTDPNGEIGLYDSVNGVFYENMGLGVFGTPSSAPSEYTYLTYIQSSGTQYIDTGFKPNQDTRVVFNAYLQKRSTGATYFISLAEYEPQAYFQVRIISSAQYLTSDFGNDTENLAEIPLPGRFVIDKNKNICTVGTETVSNTENEFQAQSNLLLLAGTTSAGVRSVSPGTIYGCQIYDNGTLVRDFVPAKNANDVIGLLDLVTQTFYTNAGSGSFTGA